MKLRKLSQYMTMMKKELNFKKTHFFWIVGILTFIFIYPINAQIISDDNRNQITYIPLDHYWSSTRTDNYSTANTRSKSGALKTNYRLVRTDGYILKESSNVEGQAVPLYLYYSDTRKDNFITATPEGIRAAEAAGYRKVRIEGYVLKTVKPEYQQFYKPLWLYYHDTRKDNFTIATLEGIRVAEAGGYRKIRIEGYISITNRNSAPIDVGAVDDSKNNFLVTNPARSTQEDLQKWNRVVDKMQGIEGFDPVGNFIGSHPAEKPFWNQNSGTNNWIPLDDKKQVCCGKLKGFQTYDGGGDEMDWNIFIDPNDEFKFLVTDAIKHRNSDNQWHKNKDTGGYLLEGEVTPDESLYDNVFFPKRGTKKESFWGDIKQIPDLPIIGKEICLYGPWVREKVHNNRPEIHPSEMIWWRESNGYYMMLIQDDSNRFDDKSDFDFGFLGGSAPNNWKPWAGPPLTAQFKIAFEVNPSESKLPLIMDIREVYNRFVVTKDDDDASEDSDNGTSHTLVVDNKSLLVVNEQQENDNDLGVKFVEITKRADGTIQGYLQITTKVGGPDLKGDEGYHILYVQKRIN